MLMNLISNIMTGTGLALLLVGVIGLIVIGPEAPGGGGVA